MTRIYTEVDGRRCILAAQGHAAGSETACAAVSAIIYALAGYVTNAEMAGRKVERYTWEMDSGDVQLDFKGDAGVHAAFEMAAIGLAQIAKAYPEQVQAENWME